MAEDFDLGAREIYANRMTTHSAPTPKTAKAQSACTLPEIRSAQSANEVEAIEGEFAAYALCTIWEKFKSLIGG